MKYQILFSGKNKKKYHQFMSDEIAQRVVKVVDYIDLDKVFFFFLNKKNSGIFFT